ncbi:MAG: hypothetical protein JWO84_781 [Parcubacteria group bacterium]|nr:hypothetical protein [Parcubacteria group bacterium]
MTQEHEVMLQSNQELLALFGLTVDEAGARIGSTRMSIRKGFREREKGERSRPVLNAEDVLRLRLMEHLWGKPDCDENGVLEQMRLRYGEKIAEQIRTVFARMSAPCQIDSYEEIWMLIPDVRHTIAPTEKAFLRAIRGDDEALFHGNKAQYLRELLRFPGKLTFYTGSPVQDELLQRFIGPDILVAKCASLAFKWDSPVSCWPTMLIGNPHGAADTYYRGKNKFVHAFDVSGSNCVQLLEYLATLSPLQRLMME